MRGNLVGLLVADPGVEPATSLAGINHAVPVGLRRCSSTKRQGRRPLLDGKVGSQEAQRLRVHGEGASLAPSEGLGEAGDDGVSAPRDIAVLVLDLGLRREQCT